MSTFRLKGFLFFSIFYLGLTGSFVKEIQTYIKQLFQSGQNELQTRDVDKENKENDRPGISTCSSHVFTNPETTNPEFSICYCL